MNLRGDLAQLRERILTDGIRQIATLSRTSPNRVSRLANRLPGGQAAWEGIKLGDLAAALEVYGCELLVVGA